MTETWTIELACCESVLLREISTPELTRRQIAQTYRLALCSSEARERLIDWGKVNRAIVERWSPHALNWIKEQAWSGKCFEEKPAPKMRKRP